MIHRLVLMRDEAMKISAIVEAKHVVERSRFFAAALPMLYYCSMCLRTWYRQFF